MECSSLYNKKSVIGTSAFFPRIPENITFPSTCSFPLNSANPFATLPENITFPSTCSFPLNSANPFATLSSSSSTVECYGQNYGDEEPLSASLAYDVLGVAPNCSADELKSAFRNKVKKFHPDVRRDGDSSDKRIRRVIQAYEMLSHFTTSEIIERECLDPFDQPECEAFDLFVNETVCIGKGAARATSQGHGEDYQVHLAVGQCPRSCIHYVTPSQRIILEELLTSIMSMPYDTSAEADLLYSLIVKACFENNRYQKPKKRPKASTKHVDWF